MLLPDDGTPRAGIAVTTMRHFSELEHCYKRLFNRREVAAGRYFLAFITAPRAQPVFPSTGTKGCSPDVISFNTVIDACVLREKWQEAVQLLEVDMPGAKVLPRVV